MPDLDRYNALILLGLALMLDGLVFHLLQWSGFVIPLPEALDPMCDATQAMAGACVPHLHHWMIGAGLILFGVWRNVS